VFTDQARKLSKGFVEPVAMAMGRVGLTPNSLTLIGSALHLIVAWLIAIGHLPLAGLALILTAAFDGFDGTLARLTGRASKLGAFLDSTFDRISEIIVFCGLLWYTVAQGMTTESLLVIVTLGFSLMVSYTRARSEALGCGTKAGVFGRFERMALLSIGLIVSPWIPISWTLWVMAIGVVLTTGQRIVDVIHICKAAEASGVNVEVRGESAGHDVESTAPTLTADDEASDGGTQAAGAQSPPPGTTSDRGR